jgi:hypothetical protein
MPCLNEDHWFAPDQLQFPPSEPALVSTSDSTDADTTTVHIDDTATSCPLPDDSTRPVDDT